MRVLFQPLAHGRARIFAPRPREDHSSRLWPHILGAWIVTTVGVSLIGAGVLWFLGFPEIERPETVSASALDGIATRAFAVVAGLSGIALLVIAYHRQRNNDQENLRAQKATERENIKLFDDRFTSAYTELGSEHAAVRLGAVQALAHLADDAPNPRLRQTCIDVLCAYLRMPYAPEPEPVLAVEPASPLALGRKDGEADRRQAEEHHARVLEYASFREVRHSILRAISDRLREPDNPWQGHHFDFTGAVFDGGDLRELDVDSGHLNFNEAHFNNGEVDFRYSRLGTATVSFRQARFNGGTVNFRHVRFAGRRDQEGWKENPLTARLRGTHADFARARFDGARVLFHDTHFGETSASFFAVEFVSGSVEFSNDRGEEACGTPPFGLWESVAEGNPGVAVLPGAWSRPDGGGRSPEYSAGSTARPEDPPFG